MSHCYLLAVCGGSVVDRHSNNTSLFNLVERIGVPPEHLSKAGAVPLEVHAYWELTSDEVEVELELRWVMQAQSGLETFSPTFRHQPKGSRFKIRSMGLPLPPVSGDYTLHVDCRHGTDSEWRRQPVRWPLTIVEREQRPRVTH